MRVVRKIGAAFALCALGLSASSHAADCDSNFSSAGNFLSGQQFKTSAQLANVAPDSAFAAVQRHLASQGWAIQHADRTAGVITAWHAGSRAERPIPLSVTVEHAPGGSKLSLSFSTPGGAFSPSGSVKEEFCKVAAAALAAPAASVAGMDASGSPRSLNAFSGTAPAQQRTQPAGSTGQICLGKACLGMTLEEATALPLDSVAFSDFKVSHNGNCLTCGGAYGINAKGQRIWYSIFPTVDKKWIQQYTQQVKLACVVGSTTVHTRASDGQLIILRFVPVIRDGKGIMELVDITRFLPKTMSESQWKAFEQQAQERYGAAFYPERALFETPAGPWVTVRSTELAIRGVRSNEDVNRKLKEQPGCSERTTLE